MGCSHCGICTNKANEITAEDGDQITDPKAFPCKTIENPIESINFSAKQKKNFEEEITESNVNRRISLKEMYAPPSRIESNINISTKLFIKELFEDLSKKYKFLKKLGSGSYGEVFLAENIVTKEKVAIKKIYRANKELLDEGEITDQIEILKGLAHPNIVRLLEFYSSNDAYYAVSEYCSGGELYDQITKNLSETQISVLIKQILSSISYLHSNSIIHRDLKLENILISEKEFCELKGEEFFTIKIIDFSTAKIYDKSKSEYTVIGSPYYIAPEVLKKNYGKECDLWSVGVMLYMFITGHPPFDGENEKEILNKIKKGVYPENEEKWLNASDEVKNLIKHLLVLDPKERLTAPQALNHDWFKKMNSDLLFLNISKEEVLVAIKSLLSYKIKSKLEELVLAYVIHNMPRPLQAKSVIKLFKLANKKGNGKLTRFELKETLLNFVHKEFLEGFDLIYDMLDGDNNGYIDYEEFLRASLDRKIILTEEVLQMAFNFFAKNIYDEQNDNVETFDANDFENNSQTNSNTINNRFISKEKIKSCFKGIRIPNTVFDQIFNEIDVDHSGHIEFPEFKKMMLYEN